MTGRTGYSALGYHVASVGGFLPADRQVPIRQLSDSIAARRIRESAASYTITENALIRDFPDELQPTTIAGLFSDFIMIMGINKLFQDASKEVSARCRTVIAPETAFIRASGAATGRPAPSSPNPPAISAWATVISAPVSAAAHYFASLSSSLARAVTQTKTVPLWPPAAATPCLRSLGVSGR